MISSSAAFRFAAPILVISATALGFALGDKWTPPKSLRSAESSSSAVSSSLPRVLNEREVLIAAFGDSLTAGYGLSESESFPSQLERALLSSGYRAKVLNLGVSGDTASAGLARLAWSVPREAELVIVELGANDALRGVDPDVTRKALDSIVSLLKARGHDVLLTGMRSPPNMGSEYARRFESIFVDVSSRHGVPLMPFFLEGVAARPSLNQLDLLHPNAAGVGVIVSNALPYVTGYIRAKEGIADSGSSSEDEG